MLDVRMVRAYKTNYPHVMAAINKVFLYKAGVHMQGEVSDRAPKDSGDLRLSIGYKVNLSKDNVAIGSNLEYAPYVEYGTRPHGNHPGTKAQPYLRKALDDNRRKLREMWVQSFRKTFRALGRL